ncbi:YheT family hydrolase [Silvimonas iriomotensis]|uniref:Alpha/beta hydrolase n=1 Tax=Silvimonas iriomotensis TaxID=449662 RepID=A0ABQ2PDN4_9NEIS|nr:alpha/beta fold hydrolase [Silvimonas iriomotensis]GGP23365.1 alpha/beta hydrolase [Silvimonas iriomotensis]
MSRRLSIPEFTEYRAPSWLPGGHLQTLYPALALGNSGPQFRRETWTTPDDDQIAVDWLDGAADQPLVVLFHGLEGSSRSHYSLSLFAAARAAGYRGVVPHFRSCGDFENRLPRAYHAGDSSEIDWVLRRIREQNPGVPIFAAGVSLGGNALLKWLGEQGSAAGQVINGAASVCAPLDLTACGAVLDQGLNRQIYTREFLRTLKKKMMVKLRLHADTRIDQQAIRRAGTLREFDNVVTAPLHGFRDVDHYWSAASSKPHLKGIDVPTLILNAKNDPFVPAHILPLPGEVSAAVTLLQPATGGHVGFAGGMPPGQLTWLPRTLLTFFEFQLRANQSTQHP